MNEEICLQQKKTSRKQHTVSEKSFFILLLWQASHCACSWKLIWIPLPRTIRYLLAAMLYACDWHLNLPCPFPCLHLSLVCLPAPLYSHQFPFPRGLWWRDCKEDALFTPNEVPTRLTTQRWTPTGEGCHRILWENCLVLSGCLFCLYHSWLSLSMHSSFFLLRLSLSLYVSISTNAHLALRWRTSVTGNLFGQSVMVG